MSFLKFLYDGKADDHHLLIWTLQDKLSRFFTSVEEAGAHALSIRDKDVYFGVGLGATAKQANERFKADEIVAIPGLWADIDYGSSHKKAGYAKSRDEAMAVLSRLGKDPSAVVHSGHGIHAYWKFREIHADENARLAALSFRWGEFIKTAAGCTVDTVSDLARVMRVPGTINQKDAKVEVETVFSDGPQYGPHDFADVLPNIEPPAPAATVGWNGVLLNAGAKVNLVKFEALCENSLRFSQSWNRKRDDMPDTSPSAYDMSLATLAAMADWSEQEIADLLIEHRRKYGDDLKLRDSYYRKTIEQAKRSAARSKENDHEVEDIIRLANNIEEKREALMKYLSAALGVPLKKIIKYMSEPPQYRLVTEAGTVTLPTVDDILAQAKFRSAVASVTEKVIPDMKHEKWVKIRQAMLDSLEKQEVGEEAKEVGFIGSLVQLYLAARPPIEDEMEAFTVCHSYLKKNRVHIFATSFRKWLAHTQGVRYEPRRIAALLKNAGCAPDRLQGNQGMAKTTRAVWILPEGMYEGL